jgi:hypothetical protein
MSDERDPRDERDASAEEALQPFEMAAAWSAASGDNGRWYFSVVDVIAILTHSDAPGTRWRVLKRRL